MIRQIFAFLLFFPVLLLPACSKSRVNLPKPDIVVAADGSGDFKTIQAATTSIPITNRERVVVFVKNAIYREKIRVDASFVTLRGQSRKGTRIEFPQLKHDFTAHPDEIGWAVINLNNADDFALENLTVENTARGVSEHAFTISGDGDRTVIIDCDVLSHGADTISLGRERRGRYYHARCNFSGSVDFVCPRGWCYARDCSFYAHRKTAAVWHDGALNSQMKFVMRNCRFDGATAFNLGRHFARGHFYFLNCRFSRNLRDKPIRREIYSANEGTSSDANSLPSADANKQNMLRERSYFHNCDRDGTDFNWFADNLSSAPGSPKPSQITAAWTFDGEWDPENEVRPTIQQVHAKDGQVAVAFSEPVTVKGKPRLKMCRSGIAEYFAGSGGTTLLFDLPPGSSNEICSVDLNGGAIIACQASAAPRLADISTLARENLQQHVRANLRSPQIGDAEQASEP